MRRYVWPQGRTLLGCSPARRFRPSPNSSEDENTEALARYLRRRGRIVQVQPRIPGGRPDLEESVPVPGIAEFKVVCEAKQQLVSRATLRDVKDQVTRYVKSGRYAGGQVRIYHDARADLYHELRGFCFLTGVKYGLPFGMEVKVDGRIV